THTRLHTHSHTLSHTHTHTHTHGDKISWSGPWQRRLCLHSGDERHLIFKPCKHPALRVFIKRAQMGMFAQPGIIVFFFSPSLFFANLLACIEMQLKRPLAVCVCVCVCPFYFPFPSCFSSNE